MKNTWLFLVGVLLAVMLESTVIAAPFVLWMVLLAEVDVKVKIWVSVVVGVILDGLQGKVLGSSSLLLLFWIAVEWVVSEILVDMRLVKLVAVVATGTWVWFVGGWHSPLAVVLFCVVGYVVATMGKVDREVRLG